MLDAIVVAAQAQGGTPSADPHLRVPHHFGLVLGVGVLGYLLRYCNVPLLPMVLGVVLGFMIESNYRRSLLLTGGDHNIFVTDNVSLGLLILAAVLTAYSLWREFAKSATPKNAAEKSG